VLGIEDGGLGLGNMTPRRQDARCSSFQRWG